jgi:CubicO group peptidase (beta-lactamase class C family)
MHIRRNQYRLATRRSFLRAGGGLAAMIVTSRGLCAAPADPIQSVQSLIDRYYENSLNTHGANVGVVAGIVTPDDVARNGKIVFAGQQTLTNPDGKRLELNERTPFEIASISKVFTSGLHYMLHGPYEGTLGGWLGSKLTMSRSVADLSLKNLAVYHPGLAQDNQGGVYPPGMMSSLTTLFSYLSTLTPPFPQGTCYSYSNLGWSLLGMAAVKLASPNGQEFADSYNAKLAQFCRGFSATNTQVFQPNLKPRLPMGYTRQFEALPASNNYQPVREGGYGSGGIVSTGADMMQFLLYNMGRLPGGLTDRALAYQQAETLRAAPCSGTGPGPTTSSGWFHGKVQAPQREIAVLNKNGGVAGFTSWMGFTGWQGTGAASSHGVFVLSNSPVSTRMGNTIMKLLLLG